MKIRTRSKEVEKVLNLCGKRKNITIKLKNKQAYQSIYSLEKKMKRLFGINSFQTFKSRNGQLYIKTNLKINKQKKGIFDLKL